MKKLLYIVPLLLGMLLTSCYNEDIEKINGRLDAIENTQIATISQQITSINNSIQVLSETDTELKNYITTLETEADALEVKLTEAIATEKAIILAELEAIKTTISELKAKDSALEGQIADLKVYVDTQLKATEDWATATFATLEQHNALASELASLKTYVDGVESSLNDAISALETSMKKWVNEQLTGYYTIAEIDAKVNALKNSYAEGKADVEQDIAELQTELTNAKSELTQGYQNAITEAINTNNGVINAKIATEISTVNEKIAGLSKRLDEIESRLSAVEDAIEQIKALDIIFGNTDELACCAGASASVDYTIVGGDEQTTIEAFGDGGWSADIVAESATTGKVVVTAPSEISKRGKVIVLATSGLGGVAMKSLYFDEGVLTGIFDTYEVGWDACTLSVTLNTNLSYSVEIPAEAQEWISLAQTRATIRTETLTFSIAKNPDKMPRAAILKVVGESGNMLHQFQIIQHQSKTSAGGYRALFVRFSGLSEGYSPYYIRAFDALSKSDMYKESYIEVVAYTWNNKDAVYCDLGIDKYYGVYSYPTVICNNINTMSNSGYGGNLLNLKQQIDSYYTDTPKVNIYAVARYDGDKYLINVIIKVNDARNYRVGSWLVEDSIEALQLNYHGEVEGVDFNMHNGVLRATCGDTAEEQFTGVDLGYLESNQFVEHTLIIEPLQTSATNTQIANPLNCRAVVFVNEHDENDEIVTVNTITTDYITSE